MSSVNQGGFHMGGKVAVITIIIVIIIALILTWLYLQHVIDTYDLDRALNEATSILHTLKLTKGLI